MATMSLVMSRRLARKAGGSDITKLANQYSKQIKGVSDGYDAKFSDYQKTSSAAMSAYDSQVAAYEVASQAQMQQQAAETSSYNAQLDAHLAALKEIEANPVTERTERVKVGRTWYGKSIYDNVSYFDPKPIPTFDVKPPTVREALAAPSAPDVGTFDGSEFVAQREGFEQGFKREVGERKSARMNAVQRKDRTLLGAAKV